MYFLSTIRLWITKKQDDDDVGGLIKNPVYSGHFPSNKTADWLDTFIEKNIKFSKVEML